MTKALVMRDCYKDRLGTESPKLRLLIPEYYENEQGERAVLCQAALFEPYLE